MATEYNLWLIFDDAGNVRLTRTTPALTQFERAMPMQINLPSNMTDIPGVRLMMVDD